MLSEEQIRTALHASRVVPLNVKNPHGPLGLEQLAAAVGRIHALERNGTVRCSITLPSETWQQLASIAHQLAEQQSRHSSPSEVAAAFVIEAVDHVIANRGDTGQ